MSYGYAVLFGGAFGFALAAADVVADSWQFWVLVLLFNAYAVVSYKHGSDQ